VGGELFGEIRAGLSLWGRMLLRGSETSFTWSGPVSEACGQCGVAVVDLCGVVDSFTRPDILGADLEEQTRACR
jgi:hypothetical protein